MVAKTETIKVEAQDTILARKSESLWQDALRRLLRNKAAVVGGVIILLLIFTAIFAPLIAPYGLRRSGVGRQQQGSPVDRALVPDHGALCEDQLAIIPSAPTMWAATCSAGSSTARAFRWRWPSSVRSSASSSG